MDPPPPPPQKNACALCKHWQETASTAGPISRLSHTLVKPYCTRWRRAKGPFTMSHQKDLRIPPQQRGTRLFMSLPQSSWGGPHAKSLHLSSHFPSPLSRGWDEDRGVFTEVSGAGNTVPGKGRKWNSSCTFGKVTVPNWPLTYPKM